MLSVDLVIPVYDGFEETRICIESVLSSVDFSWVRLVLVNDCSPNPEITEYLRALAADQASIVLLENATNLGFVATANRGMSYDPERDILLLNSDVEVAGNWLERLREASQKNDSVASITPYSNNATICSFPNFCADNRLLFGLTVGQLDTFFAENFGPQDVIEVPTGVGFCMYIPRDCLDDIGYFDLETFGKGYGEENDWCQRALRSGRKNFHLANCFVFHKGGVSFGAENNPRIAHAQEILDAKYPHYHADIQSFIAADEGREWRMRAIIELFAQQTIPKVVLVTHKLGGGAQQHVDEIAATYDGQALFLQITPEVDGESVTLRFFDQQHKLKDSLYFHVDSQYERLTGLLVGLGVGRVHFHHTMGLHPRLWKLAEDLSCEYDLSIHDYYMLNGNPTLTDNEARYVSEDSETFDERCAQHYPLPAGLTASHWRESQRLLVEGASRVVFPSADCSARFQKFFSVAKSVVAWHPDYQLSQPYPDPRWSFSSERPLKVLVMGALSREKGPDIVEAAAAALRGQAIEFHLLGYAYRALSQAVITHGPYDNRDAYSLVAEIAPDVVWFPALWPETYSYTLSIALHCGLPVVVPNLGAFVERVQGRAHSCVCAWDQTPQQWGEFWSGVLREGALPVVVDQNTAALEPVDTQFYDTAYLQAVPARRGSFDEGFFEQLVVNYRAHSVALTFSERVLGHLWQISRSPFIAGLVSLIPFRLKQGIKRRFSDKPMHDIVGR
jgi:GT2 family glycosyltransferase/glycosyltransferase involved in cell wall biosynthesis